MFSLYGSIGNSSLGIFNAQLNWHGLVNRTLAWELGDLGFFSATDLSCDLGQVHFTSFGPLVPLPSYVWLVYLECELSEVGVVYHSVYVQFSAQWGAILSWTLQALLKYK